ncbi:MAG: hypothetical protein WCH92_11205 [Betaproteobacteria bacterium]|jgi:hypothetical protein
MSANKTVMTLRSPLLASVVSNGGLGIFSATTDAGFGMGVCEIPSDEPQSAQKDLPMGDAALQFGQLKNCAAPHSEQKRFPSLTSR